MASLWLEGPRPTPATYYANVERIKELQLPLHSMRYPQEKLPFAIRSSSSSSSISTAVVWSTALLMEPETNGTRFDRSKTEEPTL